MILQKYANDMDRNNIMEEANVKQRLQGNFFKVIAFLKMDERITFLQYLLLTLEYGLNNGLENAYIVNTVDKKFFLNTFPGQKIL